MGIRRSSGPMAGPSPRSLTTAPLPGAGPISRATLLRSTMEATSWCRRTHQSYRLQGDSTPPTVRPSRLFNNNQGGSFEKTGGLATGATTLNLNFANSGGTFTIDPNLNITFPTPASFQHTSPLSTTTFQAGDL